MGTTPRRGLRYPESTVLANTLHTQIKNLADDVDAALPCARYGMSSSPLNAVGSGSWFTLIYWTPLNTHPDIIYSGTSTWTIQKAGIYAISLAVMFRNDVSSAGMRGAAIATASQGIVAASYQPPIAAQGDYVNAATQVMMPLAAGEGVYAQALQTTGGTVNVHQYPYTQICIARLN
jgi:hypothetical protein